MKQVIQGLEEGLNAIAEAVGGGGGSSIVPTPAAADEGKVLTANDDGTASWEDASGVDMTGAQAGQVLTAIQDMGGNLIQGWTTPDEGLPEITSSIEQGAVLAVGYSKEAEWENNITNLLPNGSRALVPTTSGAGNGYVLTNTNGTPTWAAASGGGGVGFVDDTEVINVVFDDKSSSYVLTYIPSVGGSKLFHATSDTGHSMEGTYLNNGSFRMWLNVYNYSEFIVTEAYLVKASGISSVNDIIPIYCVDENIGYPYFYFDNAKINPSTYYNVVINGYYDLTLNS